MLLLLSLLGALCSSGHAGPIVDTVYGALEGSTEVNRNGAAFDVFRGVPFAEPPVGPLRFTKTRPPLAWEGVRPALEFGDQCVSILLNWANATSEDCLFLNVYVPGGVDETANLPVMVWVTGGAFFLGSGQWYNPEDLIMYGPTIVVTVNYRLGPIGFLSTENAASPGNYALWDVHAALEWVQDNIAQFGGDRNRVTLFGQSAGAAITSHAAISPACQGLMHRAIMLSGASSAFFGLVYPGEAFDAQNTLALSVGCRKLNINEQVECMRNVPANRLDLFALITSVVIRRRLPNFAVVLDQDFVAQFPRASWEEGAADDLDIITGFTEHDAAAFTLANPLGWRVSFNLAETHERLARAVGFITNMYPESEAAAEAMYARYEGMSDNDTLTRTLATAQGATDWFFGSGSSQEAHLHASTSSKNTYHYNFNYRHSFMQFPEEWVAGHHCADLYALFGEPFNERFRSLQGDWEAEDADVADVMMAYVTNFAATGDPNEGPSEVEVAWPDFGDNSEMLRFRSQPAVETEDPERKADYDFWNNEFPEIARPSGRDWKTFGEEEEMSDEDFHALVKEGIEYLSELYEEDSEEMNQIMAIVKLALMERDIEW